MTTGKNKVKRLLEVSYVFLIVTRIDGNVKWKMENGLICADYPLKPSSFLSLTDV